MLSFPEKLLFIFLAAASLGYATIGFRAVANVIHRGTGQFPNWREIQARMQNAALTWLTMPKIWRQRSVTNFFHGLVMWGFVFYFLVNVGDVVQGFFPIVFMGTGIVGTGYRFVADIFTTAVLIGILYFIVRRFVLRPVSLRFRENVKLLPEVEKGAVQQDSMIVALFILLHVGYRLLGESFAVAAHGGDWGQPSANMLSRLWQGWSPDALLIGQRVGWWGALGLVLIFIPYFPYTKHFHLIMSGVNFLTKPKRTSLGALAPEDFEDETVENFGVGRIEELPWTHLVDAYACIMCNRCQDVCPAYVTGKELSPAALEVNKRIYLNRNLDELAQGQVSELRLLDFAISESAVWACTACGACVDICPVGNEPMFDILYIRRREVLMENAFPAELKSAYRGMERNGNPWNQPASERLTWTEGLNVPTVDENPTPEILWWVGCAPAYDPRSRETARAFAKVLQAAGVNYAILGELESCTGDSARRSGNEYLFYELAKGNIETLNEVAPPRIVTTCPHCMHTLGKEYPQYGGNYEVIHHTQLLAELTATKKIQVEYNGEVDRITFHDPCYLGRHNGIIDAPRTAMAGLAGVEMVEMPRHAKGSFCCGAGGAQMWKEEEPGDAAVNQVRYQEAADTGATTVAVGCPFCLTMLTDASKQSERPLVVKDVVEILAERLPATLNEG
jgi:Fe-S oxidoreductase